MSDCAICCEKLSKSVVCNFCDFETCSSCARRYLTDTESDPHCMSCKKVWSRDFIDMSFPKTFVNKDLKCHRENILIDREKSLLPSTQPLVERELHKRKYDKIIADLYKRRKELHQELALINSQIQESYTSLYYGPASGSGSEEKAQFVKKCPADDCMGYLSSQWKCGLCNLWTCPDCHEVKGETRDCEHTCLKENVESAKLINKETKPCPSCGTRIFKIEGCDQMFCTSCQTPFSWRTGKKVVSGVIHNPHYYEWMRQQNNGQVPRQPGDVPCGGLPSIYTISNLLRKFRLNNNNPDIEKLYSIHRATSHIQYTEIPRYEHVEQTQNTHSDLRVKYMLKEISEDSWKSTLQKREKKNSKNLEISQILQMFIDTSSDIFRNVVQAPAMDQIEVDVQTLESLRKYSNESLDKISKRYACVVPHIFEDWIVNHVKR